MKEDIDGLIGKEFNGRQVVRYESRQPLWSLLAWVAGLMLLVAMGAFCVGCSNTTEQDDDDPDKLTMARSAHAAGLEQGREQERLKWKNSWHVFHDESSIKDVPPISDKFNRDGETWQWVRNDRGEYLFRFVGKGNHGVSIKFVGPDGKELVMDTSEEKETTADDAVERLSPAGATGPPEAP